MTNRKVAIGNSVDLDIKVLDILGNLINTSSTPLVEIRDGNDVVIRASSSTDVVNFETGKYRLTYEVPSGSDSGLWTDSWDAVVDGNSITNDFSFTVLSPGGEINADGSEIGDAAEVSYSEEEIIGINILLAQLKARLKNNLEVESLDENGNTTFVSCSVFTNEELTWFLACSLSEFNQTPHFTDFTFDLQVIYERFAYIIVEGAYIVALGAQMLIEAGREFTITDNGVTLNPPQLSGTLNNQLTQLLSVHREMLHKIKWSIKPHPIGFGGFRVLAVSPAIQRLRHLRQRRII